MKKLKATKKIKLFSLLLVSGLALTNMPAPQADVGADPGIEGVRGSGSSGSAMKGKSCWESHDVDDDDDDTKSGNSADDSGDADLRRSTGPESSARQNPGNTGARVDKGEVQKHSDKKDPPTSGGFGDHG